MVGSFQVIQVPTLNVHGIKVPGCSRIPPEKPFRLPSLSFCETGPISPSGLSSATNSPSSVSPFSWLPSTPRAVPDAARRHGLRLFPSIDNQFSRQALKLAMQQPIGKRVCLLSRDRLYPVGGLQRHLRVLPLGKALPACLSPVAGCLPARRRATEG